MITIPQHVADAIEAVRQEERHLWLDRFYVQARAYARGDQPTVDWITDHHWEYGDAVLHGYEVGDIVPVNESP